MHKNFAILLLLLISLVSPVNLTASSPVQQAMGRTSVSRFMSTQAVYTNPALLSYIDKASASFSYRRLYNLSELDQLWIASSCKYNRLAVGVSFSNCGEADILTENQILIGLSYDLIDPLLQIGSGIGYHWIDFGLDGYNNLTRFVFDIGFAGEYSKLIYHVTLYDISRSRYTENDPSTEIGYRMGIGIQKLDDFTVNFELSGSKNDPTRFHFGQEFVLQEYLVLRFGFMTEPTLPSAGFGIVYSKLRLDYAVNRHSRLDESHSLGISYSF